MGERLVNFGRGALVEIDDVPPPEALLLRFEGRDTRRQLRQLLLLLVGRLSDASALSRYRGAIPFAGRRFRLTTPSAPRGAAAASRRSRRRTPGTRPSPSNTSVLVTT